MTNKEKYRTLCEQESTIPIFSQAWWLDAVCGTDNWQVFLVEKGGRIDASMPIYTKKKYGFTTITPPPLTQTLGPWLRQVEGKYSKVLGKQKDLLQALIDQLPPYDSFVQFWHYNNTNWLPFHWRGFTQSTYYTYVIHDLSNLDKVFANFEHSKRKNIKKSEEIIEIVYDIPFDEFYENHKMTLKKQGAEISYSKDLFKKIYEEGYKRDQAKTIAAYDKEGNLHAALFVIWDGMSAYDLISTIDPDYRTYGAASLLIKEILKFTATKTNKFDFEGSMIEPVERSFRQFGATQTPYFQIQKCNSKIIKLVGMVKTILR